MPLAVLIAGADDRLLTANLRLDAADVNLLAGDAADEWSEALLVLQTFAPLPEVVLAAAVGSGSQVNP